MSIKIFQPPSERLPDCVILAGVIPVRTGTGGRADFFTTKQTGQGTGLGLSLSYDIVKAHGGEWKVKTKECEESEFIIKLPMS